MQTQKIKVIIIVIITTSFFLSSCKKNTGITTSVKNIDYPAAYIVNGESGTISIIKLSTNLLTDSIILRGTNNSVIMWPHHIYHHQSLDIHHIAIGVPGMDLSAGHNGGMPGMKGKVIVLDAVKGTVIKDFEVPQMNHNAVFSPDGKEIWTSQMDIAGKVLVFDAGTFILKNTISVGKEPAEVTFSSDGSKVYVANGMDNSVSIINSVTKAVVATINVGANPVGAWPSTIGKMFIDNEDGQSISVIDVASNANISTINLGFKPGYVAYNPSNSELWVSDATNGKVVYFQDMGSNIWMKHGEFFTGADAHAIVFNNAGSLAYITNQGANTVSIVNTATHTKLKDVVVGKKPNGIILKY